MQLPSTQACKMVSLWKVSTSVRAPMDNKRSAISVGGSFLRVESVGAIKTSLKVDFYRL